MTRRADAQIPKTFGGAWQAATTAPVGQHVEVCMVDAIGPCPLIFPCELTAAGWVNSHTGENLRQRPSYWREWTGSRFDR